MNSAYRTLSDYGDSFTQPFAWLLFAWIGFAVAYFGLSAWLVDNLASAVAISLAATFRPWAALDSELLARRPSGVDIARNLRSPSGMGLA